MDSCVARSLYDSRNIMKKKIVPREKRTLELKLFTLILVNFNAEFWVINCTKNGINYSIERKRK